MFTSCADICDAQGDAVQYGNSMPFKHYSGMNKFSGPIRTVCCFEDNSRVKEILATPGNGCVLIVDGAASLQRALVGDLIAQSAIDNGWKGIVVNGVIRDSEIIAKMREIGVVALGTNPRKSNRKQIGTIDQPIEFVGIKFSPGMYIYVDKDGIILAKDQL